MSSTEANEPAPNTTHKHITQQEIEGLLWAAADELRVAMAEAQYASVIFPLMFWKYLSDTWDHNHDQFVEENKELPDVLSVEEAHEIEYRDYQSFEIPFIERGKVGETRASWSAVLATVTQPGLGARVRTALRAIETANPDKFSKLFGALDWTATLDSSVLTGVMQAMNRIPRMHEDNMSHDVLGGAYEYLLKRFSDGAGTRAGQFFTPREVVNLIVTILKPENFESVYDPTCGSGGMLIAAAGQLKARGGRGYSLHLYGQDSVPDTAGVARMNLFMHNLTQFQIEVGDTLKKPVFKQPDGSVAQFNVVVANPPYGMKWDPWKASESRAFGGVAPMATADWAFVQHMIASMKPAGGRAGVVLPHGVLFRGGSPAAIRQKALEEDLLEAVIGLPDKLFYSTTIPTCILLFRAPGTKIEKRRNGVLFVDASARSVKGKNRNTMTGADIEDTVAAYFSGGDPDGGRGRVPTRFVEFDEIKTNGFDLSIERYIEAETQEAADLGALVASYNVARAQRQRTEKHMLTVLAEAGIEGLDE
ncbi:type I restriction-modification system subunit M [Saccharopolyspora gloriosae]|uniref:site-specific DNA-methyltransferase (adenine-specific) n=1 Tax=Saccharopolyspora gloriosae TaxID=455344 RepID=A0A840NDJ0_9PSEU|nr:class I SAM-dependent DNA methyltransferase [Saccharopolyspora gloriosae]MBB5070406.1 type I restriction enzyme M protein [Saccharopolyspora gloriosae]